MTEVLIVAACLVGYLIVSSEVAAYIAGPRSVPSILRLGLPHSSHRGVGKSLRAAIGVLFVLVALGAILTIVLVPSAPRSITTSSLLLVELGFAVVWTAYLLVRVLRGGSWERGSQGRT